MRQKHVRRGLLRDDSGERHDLAVRGVMLQCWCIDDDDFRDIRRGELAGYTVHAGSEQCDLQLATDLLCCRNRFPRRAIQLAFPLLCYHQDHWITLASSRSLPHQALAASAADPGSICVFFPFSGK